MNQRLFDFIDEALRQCFDAGAGPYPWLCRDDVEGVLSDDARWRVMHGRLAAMEWGSSESTGNVAVTSERLLITPHGLLYAAGLSAPVRRGAARRIPAGTMRRPLYYLATPPQLFESIVDRVSTTSMLPEAVSAVDNRLGHDLLFPWPLDAALCRMLDAQPVMRIEPKGWR
ncbi:hypothetical protein ACQP2U_13770 [Nocardia sp. CA-084685]|uniref:hypothetical protein n=1 Tax=Nocardia sp. CA-084685 TaxID=3239970 RepID=UPI003D9617F7